MDCIEIKNLEVFANHGVFEEENRLGQKFVVCCDLFVDTRPAGLSDDLELSVHYGDVCKFINDFMGNKTYYLIEAVSRPYSAGSLTGGSVRNLLRLQKAVLPKHQTLKHSGKKHV